jgi:pimeloyl-ACP methyl ester carboxylesterase
MLGRMSATFSPAHRGGSGPPLLCLHGFTDTWRTWELVLPALERRYDVLAPTLPGHAGGPKLGRPIGVEEAVDAIEAMLDEAGFPTAHVLGNSLGGFLALELAVRGRAEAVVALNPAGGWAADDPSFSAEIVEHFTAMQDLARAAAPYADSIVASIEGRRRATEFITTNFEHIPPTLIAHQIRGVALCEDVGPTLARAVCDGWSLAPARITCPVRILWGSDDRVLPWPSAASRFRSEWLPHAEWIVLDGVGHCPQLDVPVEVAALVS